MDTNRPRLGDVFLCGSAVAAVTTAAEGGSKNNTILINTATAHSLLCKHPDNRITRRSLDGGGFIIYQHLLIKTK